MSDRCPRCGEVPNPDGQCACPKQQAASSLAVPAGSETARKAKVLIEMLDTGATRWAEGLTDAELADELIANLWADIPWRERKKCALLTAAIDRLKEKSPNAPHEPPPTGDSRKPETL